MSKSHSLELTKEDILLIMDCLCHATMPDFKVGRTYRGKPTYNTEMQLAELYQTIGQAMGEEDIYLTFREVNDENNEKS